MTANLELPYLTLSDPLFETNRFKIVVGCARRTRIAGLRYSFLRFPPIRATKPLPGCAAPLYVSLRFNMNKAWGPQATKPEVPRQLGKFGSNERGARRLAIVWHGNSEGLWSE